MGRPNPSRVAKFSGANADREMLIFRVQLTTSRIDNLTRLIHALAICVTIIYICDHICVPTHTYIPRYFQHAHFIPIVSVRKRGAY